MFLVNSMSKWQLKLIFIFVALALSLAAVMYTQSLVNELIDREQKSVRLYSDIYKKYADPNANLEDLTFLIDKITPMITFPMISTDENNIPNFPFTQNSLNVKIDTSLTVKKQRENLRLMILKMKKNYPPIIVEDQDHKILNKFFYSHSALIDKLQLFPLIEILVVSIFVAIGYLAFSNIRRSEESKVWVGMAKEAAHQLGTPLSSMLAWIEILKYNKENPDRVEDTLKEMENDLNRLNIIATRFSKIGSRPEMNFDNLSDNIENVCRYFEKRLPHLGRRVEIVRNLDNNIQSHVNSELFAWVIENLLKNAAEAIDNKKGRVVIDMQKHHKNKIVISVTDNGKGMTLKQKRQVFHPGFTTKKRGWGLGLSLCKRIVEDYHNGKIYVKDSVPGRGTTFIIELPTGA